VYDGDGSDFPGDEGPTGSDIIEALFTNYWAGRGLASETIPFDGRSDYVAFTDVGIPAGGIFAGAEDVKTARQVALYGGTAGRAFDPCYHQACDTMAHLNRRGLRQHKDAAVNAIWTFAKRHAPVRVATQAPARTSAKATAKASTQAGAMKGHQQRS
jgi:Zn-dependent M28 family amino/carboxypeptidase